MATQNSSRKLQHSNPHAELPVKNHKYVKNCTELYLANKRIDKVANFETFVNLEVLWINGNKIQQLTGLDECFRLKQLYVQNNSIQSLAGSSLPYFRFLQELRLYDNKLKDLQSTLNVLSRLSRLRDLDLFGNALVEEENYRLQVIRAIPSLNVLDRHVITDEERAKAARLQLHEDTDIHGAPFNQKSKKKSKTQSYVPHQAMSGTVKLLFDEVAAIKREQQKEAAEREQQELRRTRQQTFSSTLTFQRTTNHKKTDEIPSLGDWEMTALKKHFQSFELVKSSGIAKESLERVFYYLRTRGYNVSFNGLHLDEKSVDSIEKLMSMSDNISWKTFVQLFESKTLQCEKLCPRKLRQQAASCFDKCAVMQRRLQAIDTGDPKSEQLIKESFALSQQGYHLQAMADEDNLSSQSRSSCLPSSADISESWDSAPVSTPQTRFYMTTFTREEQKPSSALASTDNSFQFSQLKAESENISAALARKYKIRQKDFAKYFVKQSPPTTKLVRRNYQL